MFNKITVKLEGFLYNIKIKKINDSDLYEKKSYDLFKGVEVLNQDFISFKDFKLNIKEEKDDLLSEISGSAAFINYEEMKEANSVIKVDNLVAEKLLDIVQGVSILMEITKYQFVSPKIKIKGKEFNKYKVKIETTDLEALTDYLIDEEVVYNIKYDECEINYHKQGLIFVDKLDKKLISKELVTFNMDDENPCLENKFTLN